MEKYKEYKDSVMQWLGEIPSHWKIRKMKYTFIERSEKNHPHEEPLCATQSKGVIPQSLYEGRVVVVNKGFEGLKLVKVGDFVISLRSFQGGIEYAYYQGIISAAYTVLQPKDANMAPFFKYLFKSHDYVQLLQTCVTGIREGQNINYPLLSKKAIPLPPLVEQHSIVSYLDTKCSQLDTLLSNKEKEISLLQEMKQRVIADAVTRGINPSVKFKTTNIPWLQEIPEHWGKVKLKVLTLEGKNKNNENLETNVLSLSYGKIIRKKNINDGLVPSDYATYQIVDVDDIILRLTDLQNDHRSLRCGLVKERGIITSAYVCLKIRQGVSEYFYFLLHSFDIKKVFYSMGGGLRQSINYTEVSKLHVPVPPLSEQRSIVSYITERASKIDLLIEKLNKEIESIKEYKQRLISDVVTGQVKVC